MHGQITITALERHRVAKEYVMEEPAELIVGRAEDCDIRLPTDFEHADVSRHHCAFEVDPPAVRVRDLGSRNGTFVNDVKIGQRPFGQVPEEAEESASTARELKDGDEVRVGHNVFRVGIDVAAAAVPPLFFPPYF